MNERRFALTNGTRLAMVVIVALLLALAAVTALSSKAAEAAPCWGTCSPAGGAWGSYPTAPTAANDNFSAAVSLPWSDWSGSGTTNGATLEYGEPKPSSCGGSPVSINHSVWYKLTPYQTDTVTFTPSSSDFDAVLVLYKQTGSSLTSLSGDKCSYTARGKLNPMTAQLYGGQTYYLQLSSDPTPREGGGSYEMGPFSLKVDSALYSCSQCQNVATS